MIKRQLAENILKELTAYIFDHYLNKKHLSQNESEKIALKLYNHCLHVAEIATKIAKHINIDSNKCYIFGLLHKLGKFNLDRFCGLAGYEIAMENNEPELAKICITHFYSKNMKEINLINFPNNEFRIQDMKKTIDLIKTFQFNDYDKLLKLCNFIVVNNTINIENNFENNKIKHKYEINAKYYHNLHNEIINLKQYFENKYSFSLDKLINNINNTIIQ